MRRDHGLCKESWNASAQFNPERDLRHRQRYCAVAHDKKRPANSGRQAEAVYHLNEIDKVSFVLGNIQNHL